MRGQKGCWVFLGVIAFLFVSCGLVLAQEASAPAAIPEAQPAKAIENPLAVVDTVSLDFKDADIRSVLKIIAQKANINIVPTNDVIGNITIKLVEVPWERALDIILKSNGFGFQRQGNVILVTKAENLAKFQSEEPLKTEIVDLKFLDAQDARRIIAPMLSSRGSVSILYNRGQKGWKFGSFKIGKEDVSSLMQQREKEVASTEVATVSKDPAGVIKSTNVAYEPSIKSKTVIITDTDAIIDRIINDLLPKIDRKPKQILVEARFMEVNRDRLKDIGFDYGTGSTGAESTTLTHITADSNVLGDVRSTVGANSLTSLVNPSNFGAKSTTISGTTPYKAGLDFVYRRLVGTEYEIILHALEEDVHANTLSAPRILTLDNQEASMLVGYHTPILTSTVSAGSSTEGPTQTQTLDYYQEIGIRLNVVPQVSEDGYINMIIHPSITSSASNVTATNVAGTGTGAITTTIAYPIIDVREAQTQILMKDGETVVIGGLLKEVKSKGVIGIPFLSKIPFLGSFFRRDTVDTAKVDLLIFITARVVTDEDFSAEEIAKLETRLGNPPAKQKAAKKAKK